MDWGFFKLVLLLFFKGSRGGTSTSWSSFRLFAPTWQRCRLCWCLCGEEWQPAGSLAGVEGNTSPYPCAWGHHPPGLHPQQPALMQDISCRLVVLMGITVGVVPPALRAPCHLGWPGLLGWRLQGMSSAVAPVLALLVLDLGDLQPGCTGSKKW